MAKQVMLDTNVVLAWWHNEWKTSQRLESFKSYQFCISSLVAAEVLVGTHLPYKTRTKKFLRDSFKIFLFDEDAAEHSLFLAGRYFVDKSSKPYDLLIAAHALSMDLPIITDNTKDYAFGSLSVFHFS